jgi:hypothetical protein
MTCKQLTSINVQRSQGESPSKLERAHKKQHAKHLKALAKQEQVDSDPELVKTHHNPSPLPPMADTGGGLMSCEAHRTTHVTISKKTPIP